MRQNSRYFLKSTYCPGGEEPIAEAGALTASWFRFDSGVCAVRLRGPAGSLVVLPFQGQQIWSLELALPGGAPRPLSWRSPVTEPQPTTDFLATFGGFLQHCGLLGVGGPGPQDSHPLHGELPNAPFQRAWLAAGADGRGPFLGVGGVYRHSAAFGSHYTFSPLVKLYADPGPDQPPLAVELEVTNQARSPLEMAYLAHINFRPVDHARLVSSVPRTPQHLRLRAGIPAHIVPKPGYRDLLAALERTPTLHETLLPGQAYDPEACFFLDYEADAEGWAHTLQVHPDGSADYLRHRPAELPRATRWISRTPDQDAIAMAEVGISEPEGMTREREKGNLRVLAPGETFRAGFDVGLLRAEAARALEAHIATLV